MLCSYMDIWQTPLPLPYSHGLSMTSNVIFFVAENKHFVQIGVRIKFLQKGLVVVVYNGKIEFVTKVLAHHNCYSLFWPSKKRLLSLVLCRGHYFKTGIRHAMALLLCPLGASINHVDRGREWMSMISHKLLSKFIN